MPITSSQWMPSFYLEMTPEAERVRANAGMDLDGNGYPRFRISNDSASGQIFTVLMESASPADNDAFTVGFAAVNDNDRAYNAASIDIVSLDVTDTTEDGRMDISTMRAGTLTQAVTIDQNGRLGIGTTAPVGTLHVIRAGTALATTYAAIVQNNDDTNDQAEVVILSGNIGSSSVCFGDADNETIGQVTYDNNDNSMAFQTNLLERMRIDSVGGVGIGLTSIDASALLELSSTTKGFRLMNMTTTQRDAISSPAAGLTIYNSTTNKQNFYNGSAWEVVTSS